MSTTVKNIKPRQLEWNFSENEKDSGGFSANNVVDAYLKGKSTAKDEVYDNIQKELNSHIESIGNQTNALLSFIQSVGIVPFDVLLRINSLKSFDVLIIINEKDFLSNNMNKVYKYVLDISKLEHCFYNFNFVSKEGLNMDAVSSDDYHFRHKFNVKNTKSRNS